jgi:hypothetical protein
MKENNVLRIVRTLLLRLSESASKLMSGWMAQGGSNLALNPLFAKVERVERRTRPTEWKE